MTGPLRGLAARLSLSATGHRERIGRGHLSDSVCKCSLISGIGSYGRIRLDPSASGSLPRAASQLVSVAVLRWQICIMAVSTSPARLDGLPTLPGVEHHWLDVQTGSGPVRLHLAATGSGPPVLLLHGWPQHWCWRRVVKQLRDYRLLIPDLRGFGWSEAPGSGYSPTGFADDAMALLDALDIAHVHVIGHDWGGFTGFLLGLHHSGRVDRLLLCNSPGPWAQLSPRTAVGLRRSWYAGLVATPILGHRLVAYPGFIPWFLRLGGQMPLISDSDATVYADQFRDRARTAASSQLYRSYWRLRMRFCCGAHSRDSGCRLRPMCCSAPMTSISPWRCSRRSRPTGPI
jgi:pimeloyl-ACP methyl ester carboxylesterase